ncbi:MAG: NAD(P)/FAD-dependent oxidoreductase [Acutalibacteraceae bacterium]|nr:NAD(P)/FAD-dependent oxidoreductase [Acutalibacteraceae bacterium]
MKRIVIIGGGAAGLAAAISASEKYKNQAEVTLIEKNERPARKVMITGKGRCNVTNNCNVDTLIANVPKNGKFLYSAFSGFTPKDVISFFETAGVPLKTERGNRVFPVSDKAVDIVDSLVKTAKSGGTKFINATAAEILAENGSVSGVKLTDGRVISADSVILATGGMSYPLTGSTGDGYKMAQKLGHTVTELKPSLVPLCIHEGFCTKIAGLSLKNVTLSIFETGKKKPLFSEMGEMLFTHFGISGPLVLSASSHIRYMGKKEYTAFVDLKPALSIEQLDNRILRDFGEEQNKDFANSLSKLLPKSLIPVIIKLSGIKSDKKVNQIEREERLGLCKLIKALPLHITGFRPIEEAIITSGGISVKEIDPKTMQSKLVSGLFFAGEIIDVDAYTGGFNLQIAFSTGFAAGKNA